MSPEDYTPVCDRSGKMIGRRVTSKYGNEYIVGTKMGAGGVAKVYHCQKVGDKNEYVFKEFITKPGTRRVHALIKQNIIHQLKTPLKDSRSNGLPHYVRPLDIVELSTGFGYVMEKVDTSAYKPIIKIINHHEFYPDAKQLCIFCKNFAKLYKAIHLSGFCYKDINEGNIYIRPEDGDFWIIDADNINIASVKTILGTPGYIAPEVYKTETPDTQSDYFSIATFFFRLLIGSYPMDGPATERYMLQNNLDVQAAAGTIYGTQALFAFHPTDKRNAVYTVSNNSDYQVNTRKWNALPPQIKKCFMQTFVIALPYDKRALRTNDVQWYNCFDDLEQNHLVLCKKCKKYNFDNRTTCYHCGHKLPINKKNNQNTGAGNSSDKYEVVCDYKRIVNGKQEAGQIAFELGVKIPGSRLHPDFSSAPMLYLYHRPKENMYVIHNCGPLTWDLSRNGKVAQQPPNSDVQVNTNLVIKVDRSKCLLKVLGLRKKK